MLEWLHEIVLSTWIKLVELGSDGGWRSATDARLTIATGCGGGSITNLGSFNV
jgi:hypothetical protein